MAGIATIDFSYDPTTGTPYRVIQGTGAAQRLTTFAYNGTDAGGTGQLQNITAPDTTTSYTSYDANARATGVTLPGTRALAFGFDASGNLATITPPGDSAHTFAANGNNQNSEYEPPPSAASR